MAKLVKERWGREPRSWCKFPMTGSFHGPGGNFGVAVLFLLVIHSSLDTMNKKRKKVMDEKRISIWGEFLMQLCLISYMTEKNE